jgi:hypothetical protein
MMWSQAPHIVLVLKLIKHPKVNVFETSNITVNVVFYALNRPITDFYWSVSIIGHFW